MGLPVVQALSVLVVEALPLVAATAVPLPAELVLPLSAAGVTAVGTTVLVIAPVGSGIVTTTVTGVAAHPESHTFAVA